MIKMKESGVEWIGQIPEDWKLKRLKIVLQERNENNNPVKTDYILSLTNDKGVIPYSEKGDIGNKSKDDITGYKLAYPNDIVLNSMNVVIGSVGISNYFGAVSPVYYMLRPRNKNDDVRYYNYIFQTKEFQNKLKGYGNGILEIRMRIQMLKLNTVELPVPSSEEQVKIADFLDKKCSQINALIKIQEKEIEKIKQYKQAVISEVVTKGLDRSVKMKDSGVEWIGEVPVDWEVKKLKFCYKNRNTKYTLGEFPYIALENIESFSGKYVYTETNSNYLLEGSIIATKGDVIFGKLRPYLTKAFLIESDSCVSTEFAVFYSNENNSEFLKYLFLSYRFIDIINSSTYGTKMPRANIDFINNLEIALPNLKTQQEISEYLEKKSNEIDNLIQIKKFKIQKLQDYQKSLIYEYVTGKKRCI